MSTLVPVQLENGMTLYIEAQEDATVSASTSTPETGEENTRNPKGWTSVPTGLAKVDSVQSMKMVQDTIRTYTYYCLTAFKNFGAANVDEVTLEFGVNLSADAGIPYIASGKAQSNLKITVKCSYPNKDNGANGAG